MARIVILGDSLSLPRPMENILYEDTYPYILFQKGYEILNRSRRANDTIVQMKKENIDNDLLYIEPNIVIVHLGIVDCAPRLFYRLEGKVFRVFNRVVPIVKFMSKFRYSLTKVFPKVYVRKRRFEENIDLLFSLIHKMGSKIIVVGIADTTIENKRKSYAFENNILSYNKIIKQLSLKHNVSAYVDMYKYGENALLEDGVHLNKKMIERLADIISAEIQKIENHDKTFL